MAATTIDHRPTLRVLQPAVRLLLAVAFTVGLLAAAFAIGRASAPSHEVRSPVPVPAVAATAPADACQVGRLC